mgnify:CR=1 FL=1
MTGRWLSAWGLAAVAFGGASLIVPLYVVELGGGAFVLGLLFASSSFGGVPGALALGNLADRTGKRRIFVLAAIAVTAATMVAIPLLDSILAVILANVLLWLGFAAATPVLTLLVVAGAGDGRHRHHHRVPVRRCDHGTARVLSRVCGKRHARVRPRAPDRATGYRTER